MRMSFHSHSQIMILFMNFMIFINSGFTQIVTPRLNSIPHDIVVTHKYVLMVIHSLLGPYYIIHAILRSMHVLYDIS